MHKTTLFACCAILCLGVSLNSCKEEPLPQKNFPQFNRRFHAALQPVSSCEELETQARNAAFLRIQASYSLRLEHALEQLRTADSKTCQYAYAKTTTDEVPLSSDGAALSGEGAASVSGTNNQIAEVDEADILKADNQHLYVAKGNQLRIFKSWPPGEAKELSSTPIEGLAKRLLKVGNQLLVISFVADNSTGHDIAYLDNVLDPHPPYSSKTFLTLFDVSNPSSPQKSREIGFKARFETARSIGNNAILVLSQADPHWLDDSWYPEICDGKKWASEKKLRADHIHALNKAYRNLPRLPHNQLGLHVADSLFGTSQSCATTFINPMPDGAEQTTVVRIDLSQNVPIESATLMSRAGEIFVSEDNVYMAVPLWHAPNNPWFENWEDQTHVSLIHQFMIPRDNPSPSYAASGIVKGNVLNSFSMDEAEGFLRVATTLPLAWWTNNPRPQENVLSVLRKEGSTLKLHGQLDGLAPNEQIRSARFAKNRAYIVTFRQVDPLFAIELSDPGNPQVLGELKIPGFSTYLHPLSDNRLLTVGYDADENTGFVQGIQVQLFDVSKPEALRRIAHQTLSRYSSSEAAQTHLGFAYCPSLSLLALPATEWNLNHYGYPDHIHFEGVRLFHVNLDTGFEPRGSIEHPNVPPVVPYKLYASSVLRNVFMSGDGDDFLYSLSNNALFATQLGSTPPQIVNTLFLNSP
jgi:uncharacterized secreted protein with C-terminal beta-propeller domain